MVLENCAQGQDQCNYCFQPIPFLKNCFFKPIGSTIYLDHNTNRTIRTELSIFSRDSLCIASHGISSHHCLLNSSSICSRRHIENSPYLEYNNRMPPDRHGKIGSGGFTHRHSPDAGRRKMVKGSAHSAR